MYWIYFQNGGLTTITTKKLSVDHNYYFVFNKQYSNKTNIKPNYWYLINSHFLKCLCGLILVAMRSSINKILFFFFPAHWNHYVLREYNYIYTLLIHIVVSGIKHTHIQYNLIRIYFILQKNVLCENTVAVIARGKTSKNNRRVVSPVNTPSQGG